MYRILQWGTYAFVLAISCTPLAASAHALPVGSVPAASEMLDTAPKSVSITFSEHIDASASTLSVAYSSGAVVSVGTPNLSANRYTLSVPVSSALNGEYVVSWSAVSADDGHFTKGAFPYAVGTGAASSMSSGSSEEIVEVATAPEALASSVELMGHGMLWAVLLLFAFVIRRLVQRSEFENDAPLVRKICARWIYSGATLAFVGGLLQILIKTSDLGNLQTISFLAALPKYVSTAAGSATLGRMIAVMAFIVIFTYGKKTIQAARTMTVHEYALAAILCCFAYLRAKISHATSNPFHPEFSIAVNFLHVIEKDIWAGVVGLLLVFCLSRRLRDFFAALIPGAFAMLAIDFGAVSVTACYIVWLHLKSFDNLFTTQWGAAFLELLIAAVLVVGMRFYHVFMRLWRPVYFARFLPSTLAIEFAFGILVVYFSSVVIITSPPLATPPTPVFQVHDQGATIALECDLHENDMLMLSVTGPHTSTTTDPVVTIADEGKNSEPLSIGLSKRFTGGYVFSSGLLEGAGPFKVVVTAPQQGAYDAHATFDIKAHAFDIPSGWEHARPWNSFTLVMILIALAAAVTAVGLFYLSELPSVRIPIRHDDFTGLIALISFVVALFGACALISTFHASSLENSFRAQCESDGNMWHVMQPMKAGIPTSPLPAEGCMWGMGKYTYMFPDKHEYEYDATLAHAVVTLTHAPTLTSGVPTTLTVSLKNADGTPAQLFVDMEKLIHVVIVSRDETVFAHIHPDDVHPLTKQEIDTSTFTAQYTFPKSGQYLVSVDYAHGVTLESQQFTIDVTGSSPQAHVAKVYQSPGKFDGYDVSLDYSGLFAGEVSTFKYTITKNGAPVTDIVPYLSAAMHVSVVKNDFSTFIHTHGEVHPPGAPLPPIIVKNGQVVHSMAMMVVPPTFGPTIEAHMIFPTPGMYTIWGEFKVGAQVISTSFTVQVE